MRALLAHYLRDDVSLDALGSGRFATREFLDECLSLPTVNLRLAEIETYLPAVCRQLARDIGEERKFFKAHAANAVNSHGARLFPADAGAAIHIVRNPLDVAASMIPFFGWPAEQAAETLADESFVLNPSQADPFAAIPERLLSWSQHAASWMDCPNLRTHTLRYEDLRVRPEAVFAEALCFVGIEPVVEHVARAVERSRIERLQSEERESGFGGPAVVRQGALLSTGEVRSLARRTAPRMRPPDRGRSSGDDAATGVRTARLGSGGRVKGSVALTFASPFVGRDACASAKQI